MNSFYTKFRTSIIIGVMSTWHIIIGLIGIWWATLIMKLSRKISELEVKTGVSAQTASVELLKTERMLFWETSSFVVFVIIVTAFLSWLYLRDLKRSRAIQAFFASFTHELRTPVTSIRLQAESIAENKNDPEVTSKLITRLLEESSRLESQIEKTLELARVEGGGAVQSQAIPVQTWLEKFIRQFQGKSQMLEITTNLEDVEVMADRTALLIIFRNCIENSMKHSQKSPVKIDIQGKRIQDEYEIILKDNGLKSSNHFELGTLFYKGKNSQGAGVGLYLIKMLMNKMNGKAKFESTDSGFKVTLIFKVI